jgi:hypothetical protein
MPSRIQVMGVSSPALSSGMRSFITVAMDMLLSVCWLGIKEDRVATKIDQSSFNIQDA